MSSRALTGGANGVIMAPGADRAGAIAEWVLAHREAINAVEKGAVTFYVAGAVFSPEIVQKLAPVGVGGARPNGRE